MEKRVPQGGDHVSDWFSANVAEFLQIRRINTIAQLSKIAGTDLGLRKSHYVKFINEVWQAYLAKQEIYSYADPAHISATKPAEPTTHPSGSPGKIEELRRRFESGQQLHHEWDNKQLIKPSEE
jgi:hypothetical protein